MESLRKCSSDYNHILRKLHLSQGLLFKPKQVAFWNKGKNLCLNLDIFFKRMLNRSFWYPHLIPMEGGRSAGPLAISKTVAPMKLKFCRLLEMSMNILEMFKLFTQCYLGYLSNSSKEMCFVGKIA